ncbi:MAG TPA: transporter substrate-binding domain-containing protein, partial [Thermoanaerobaculia bacterium]|nr:transporter substrate-binding domain-containing protein [Thermoanaerobaculia bacterium]
RVLEFREEVQKLGIVGRYSGVRGSEQGFFERVERDLRRLLQRPELSGARITPTSAPSRSSRLDFVLSKKRLRCGVTKHPPLADYQFTDDRFLTFSGYYVDLARDVGARNGLQIDFVPIQWHEFVNDMFAIPAAHPRAIDLVLSVFETHDRREYADFTCNFHCVDLCAVVQTDSPIQSLDDLRNTRLRWAVAEGEAGWEYAVRELRIDSYDTIVVKHPDIGTALGVLGAGGDVAVVDRLTADKFIAAHPTARIRLLGEQVWQFKNGIMIPRRDPDFEEWVRTEFSASRRTPPLAEAERQMLADCRGAVKRYA